VSPRVSTWEEGKGTGKGPVVRGFGKCCISGGGSTKSEGKEDAYGEAQEWGQHMSVDNIGVSGGLKGKRLRRGLKSRSRVKERQGPMEGKSSLTTWRCVKRSRGVLSIRQG